LATNTKSAIKPKSQNRNRLRNKENTNQRSKTLDEEILAIMKEPYAANPTRKQSKEVQQQIAASIQQIDKAVKTKVLHQIWGRKKSHLKTESARASCSSGIWSIKH